MTGFWRWAAAVPVVFGLAVCCDSAVAQDMSNLRVAPCGSGHLSANVEPGAIAAATGRQAMTIAVQNRSSSPCELAGVPEIAFADSRRRTLPVHVCSNCPVYLFPVLPVEAVVLQPRQSAYLVVGYKAMSGDEGCREAATFSMRLTKNGKPIRIHLSGLRPCGVVDVTPFLAKLPPNGVFPGSEGAKDAQK